MSSSSESDSEGERKLPLSYRRKRRRDSSSTTNSEVSDNDRKKRQNEKRRSRESSKMKHQKTAKRDKPMWKEEGEISCDSESDVCNSSSSNNRSRCRDRRRRTDYGRRRHRNSDSRSHERWSTRRRQTTPEGNFRCDECGCNHYTLKGLIHHEMNDHNLNAKCHLCQKSFENKKTFREHCELDHTPEVVRCVFCKSSFDQPLEMNDEQWAHFFAHIYGEILYSRLADYEDRALNTA
ncbi:C2H2-type domain-containing protein [Caenorhabditis elegans]|uniref:C2H2-type domain-containing protein n=1 Tax=Caenorhabditis elegans TaxID=6239 RepID=Q22621_CAEEL|nr:C2H2-type domain-containing protein [Caenorhabditis elegans]CCD73348.1 C2H2-type domain-containing protein [Caenorhabditis elegans]|eukprot:NP_498597.1 Uncharacterized protein CELE_T20H4.2 [Caenorhabditis elegans]